ncbi:MAG: tetratricopeptide repeat protein, partial [Armatimonadia bacterium]|nr:tetratricopeptide repeat protein [Armatimonadia bacterium]
TGTWLSLASTLQSALRWDEAKTAYRRALELEPSAYYAASLLASLLGNMGRYDEALAMADRALAINPDEFGPHQTKVNAYRGLGRIEDALAEADRIIQMEPDRHFGYTCRASLLRESGAPDEEVLAVLDDALEHAESDDDEWSVRKMRGQLLAEMGRWEDALVDLQRAIEFHAGHLGVYSALAQAQYHLGNYAEAWQAIHDAERAGMKYGWTPDEEFVERLREAMPEPPVNQDDAGAE